MRGRVDAPVADPVGNASPPMRMVIYGDSARMLASNFRFSTATMSVSQAGHAPSSATSVSSAFAGCLTGSTRP